MEKSILNKWSISLFMILVLPLTIACGDDNDDNKETELTRVFPTFIFSGGLSGEEGIYCAEGYATPDFTQPRGGIVKGEKNYMFQYAVKLIDEKAYRYEFNLTDGGSIYAYDAEVVWVTDSKFNFALQWNDVSKEYDILNGYFAGGKLENIMKANGGVSINVNGESHYMSQVLQFTISLNEMKVTLGVPR